MTKDLLNLKAIWPGYGQRAYREEFFRNPSGNLFLGSFESFASAQAAVPPGVSVGYDNQDAATKLYSPQVNEWDYPAVYWLAEAFSTGMTRVFDLGGHVGIKYHAFKRIVRYPARLRWTVCDVPSVTQVGEEQARQQGVSAELDFCTDFSRASGTEVLFASGSLQYLPITLREILHSLEMRPKRIILNTTAVHEHRTMYTLNSILYAVCPYRIQHHEALFRDLRESGYRRRDVWRNDSKPIHIPFVDGGDAAYYVGCCFDRVT